MRNYCIPNSPPDDKVHGMKALISTALMLTALLAPQLSLAQNATASTAATPARKQRFFLKLAAPRPTFAADMTPEEAKLMQQHADYWTAQFAKGTVLIIGPVLDPKGAFCMAVLETATEEEARSLAMNDPSVKAGLNTVEVSPMRLFLMKK
jgi:uncharacterized protein